MDTFLHHLLQTDWLHPCTSQHYCFACLTAVCPHCCPHHNASHHGADAREPAFVGSAGGAPAIRLPDCAGCGFSLKGIQKLVSGRAKWIPITAPAQDRRVGGTCSECGRQSRRKKKFCSMACRGSHVGDGELGVAMVQHLEIRANQFGQPVHQLDTICRVCNRCFCSALCPDHLEHQGHHGATAADLVHIHHTHGMAFVDAIDLEGANLPEGFGDSVQSLEEPDTGLVLYPIHRRPLHQVDALGDPDVQPCTREDCWEVTHGGVEFCSLRCLRG